MATYTPNLNLSKPENTDSQQSFISDYCDNMDKLDNAIGESVTDVEVNGVSVVVGGVAQVTVPTKTSDLNNDSGFITSTVNNLTNYYLKSETYTKAEVQALIASLTIIDFEVVATLPTSDISTSTIYLVPKSTAQTDNIYDEYINTDGTTAGWEKIGDTEIDLSNYYTKTEADTLLNGKVSKTGDTMTGSLEINSASANVLRVVRTHSGTAVNATQVIVGNNIADGNVGATYGNLILYGDGTRYGQLQARNLTASRTFQLPNKSGTVALTDDIQTYISDFKTPTDAVITDGVAEFDTLEENYVKELTVDIKPVQSGSGDPSPDNVRPFSGHTQADIKDVGKNYLGSQNTLTPQTVFDIKYTPVYDDSGNLQYIEAKDTASANSDYYLFGSGNPNVYVPINIPTGDYIVTDGITTSQSGYGLYIVKSDGTIVASTNSTSHTASVSLDANETYRVFFRVGNGKSVDFKIYPMIRKSTDTDSTFEPYNGYSVTIPFDRTVYVGTLDVIRRVLTVTHGYSEYDGSSDENWSVGGTGTGQYKYMAIGSPNTLAGLNIYCNEFVPKQIYTSNQNIGIYTSLNQVRVRPDFELTDATAWKTWLTTHPIQLAYELATPQTYQLTPQQIKEIKALLGENNISCPLDGQSIAICKYTVLMNGDDLDFATVGKVDISALGTDESGNSTASRAYTTGEFFYKDGKMYKVLTNIASGATFTVGTNISETTLFAELTALA